MSKIRIWDLMGPIRPLWLWSNNNKQDRAPPSSLYCKSGNNEIPHSSHTYRVLLPVEVFQNIHLETGLDRPARLPRSTNSRRLVTLTGNGPLGHSRPIMGLARVHPALGIARPTSAEFPLSRPCASWSLFIYLFSSPQF